MSRFNSSSSSIGGGNGAKGSYVPPPSSAAIASAVSLYMAGIETRSPTAKSQLDNSTTTATSSSSTPRGRKAKQKQNAYASSSIDAATAAAQLQNPGANFCRNPFCGAQLESRFAKYCAKKSYCQLYRGLQLHCGSFVTEHERTVDEALSSLREAKRRRLHKSAGDDGDEENDDDGEFEKEMRAKVKTSAAEFSIPKRKIPVAPIPTATASSGGAELSKEERRAQRKIQRRIARQEEAAAALVESSDAEQLNGRKRRLILDLRGDSSSSSSTAATAATAPTPPLPPTPVSAPSVQTKAIGTPLRLPTPTKVSGIEVIPLGAGRHPSSFGGGSRYVQSGNRTAVNNLRVINPLARQPTAVASTAKPPLSTESASPLLPVVPSSRSEQTGSRFQARASASGSAMPTPRASLTDPRRTDYSTGRSEMTPASSPTVAQEFQAPQQAMATNRAVPPVTTAKRIISASEYMSSRKPQDLRMRTTAPSGGEGPPSSSSASLLHRSSSELSNTPMSSSYLNGVLPPPSRERIFSRSQSDSDVLRSFTSRGSRDGESLSHHQHQHSAASTSNGSRISARQPSAEPLYSRSSSYDDEGLASAYIHREYDSRDSFGTERSLPLPSRPYLPDRYHDQSYEPDYHRPSTASLSSLYPQDQQHWQRRQEDSVSRRSDEPPSHPPLLCHLSPSRDPGLAFPPSLSRMKTDHSVEHVTVNISSEQQKRDVNVHPQILPVAFSRHDPFVVNLLSRFASFFPKALAPVLNKTKKPRKMRFYLDYVERVKQLAGWRLDVQVADGKGVVTVEGREWLVLKGQSTVDLYTQILETLLEQGTAWKKLIDDSNRVYSHAVKRFSGNHGLVERSESFLRMWRGMKTKIWKDFPTERQVTYFHGSKRHHWAFCVGNVEIGSGSHEEKNEALRLASDASMKFLLNLEILSEREKYGGGGEFRRYEFVDRDSDSSTSQQRPSSARNPLPPRATRISSSVNNNNSSSSGAAPQAERSSTSVTPTTASRPSPVVVEIVETPDVTVTRVRDDSFSSNADGTFSPMTQSDHSVTEEDMEISDGDDARTASAAVTSASRKASHNASKNPEGCAFCDMVRLRDPDASFCMRCKAKQSQAPAVSGRPSFRASSPRFGRESSGGSSSLSLLRATSSSSNISSTLELLQNGLTTRR